MKTIFEKSGDVTEEKSLENHIDKAQKSSQALWCLSQPCGKAALTIHDSFYGRESEKDEHTAVKLLQ